MRVVLSIIVVLLCAPSALAQTTPVAIDVTASFFTRYELRQGYRDVGLADSDAVRYRTRLGLVAGPFETGDLGVVLRFVPQAAGVWHVGGDTLEDPSIGVHEGLVELHGQGYRLDAGRFEMTYGEHLVIGNVDWNPTARAFDGLRLHLQPVEDGAFVDGFATILGEGSIDPSDGSFAAGDAYFGGVYAGIGPLVAEKLALDVYALALGRVAEEEPVGDPPVVTRTDGSLRLTVGSRFRYRSGAMDYRAEAGAQLGEAGGDRSIRAFQGDVEAGVNVLGDRLRFAVEGLYATGDDPSTADVDEGWHQLFPTAHKWLGYADIIGGRTNVAGVVVHVSGKPVEDVTLSLDGHWFVRPEDTMVPDPANPGLMMRLPSSTAGWETDVGGAYQIVDGLRARAGYSLFVPDEDWYGTSDPVHFAEIELRYDR